MPRRNSKVHGCYRLVMVGIVVCAGSGCRSYGTCAIVSISGVGIFV